jgi:hypothetical protein
MSLSPPLASSPDFIGKLIQARQLLDRLKGGNFECPAGPIELCIDFQMLDKLLTEMLAQIAR